MTGWDAIVLAGGAARRLDGADKARVTVGGVAMLDRVLAAVQGAERVVVVGDVAVDGVRVVVEEPRFAGPAAAVATGLREVTAPWVVLLACDQPFAGEAVGRLLDERSGDGVVALDPDGRRQHLMCVVSVEALRRSVASRDTVVDLSMRALLAPLDLAEVPVSARAAHDVDTWHDRDSAQRAATAPEGHTDD